MRKFASNRKGFTLVELLIVIVVIGILSAMMMLSSSEAVSSAKATAIISDLRNLKTAALAYFADHIDTQLTRQPATTGDKDVIPIDDILVYLNGKEFPNKNAYKVIAGYDVGSWFVECNIGDGKNAVVKGAEAAAVKKKLAGRAKSVGLLSSRRVNADPYDGVKGSAGKGGMYVTMLVQ